MVFREGDCLIYLSEYSRSGYKIGPYNIRPDNFGPFISVLIIILIGVFDFGVLADVGLHLVGQVHII